MNNHKQKDCDEDDDVGRHPPKRQRRDENYRDNIINQRDNNGTKKCVDNRLGNDHSSKYTSVKDEDKQPLHKLIESLRYNLGTGNKCPVEAQCNDILDSLARSLQKYTGDDCADSINKLNNYSAVSDDSGGEDSEEELAGEEDDNSTPKTNYHSIPPLPSEWASFGCPAGINCNDINCISDADENDVPPNIVSPSSISHELFRGKRIRISGSFNAHGISQDKCKGMLVNAGASEVKMHTSFGDADILIAGIGCSQSLLDDARRGGKVILSCAELLSRLELEGYSTSNSTIMNESELADRLISEKCQFDLVDNESSVGLKQQCITALPKELKSSRVFDNKQLVVEVGQHEFSDPLLTSRNGTERQMMIRITRIKGKDGSEWQDHYMFFYKKQERNRSKWTRYCVQHNKEHRTCGECNSCPHGFGSPHIQCTECCPWISCIDCGREPRLANQSSCGEYTNRCARCYRLSSGGMTYEDRCIKYILDSGIPVSSIDKFVFGLPYRTDAEITESPYNDISYECDDKRGHNDRSSYPEHEQHQRTVELNECRPWAKGKITIRQHPLDITDTPRQEKQNQLMVRVIKRCMKKELGLRGDGQGKRLIIFIGHSTSNYHYQRALKEKENGYWDYVSLLAPR